MKIKFQVISRTQKIDCNIADTGLKKTIGLMMQRNIKPLFFDFGQESRYNCMHTLFMLRPIDMVFINSQHKVVDIKTAKPFRPFFQPKEPARYCIELPEGMGKMFQKGEILVFRGINEN